MAVLTATAVPPWNNGPPESPKHVLAMARPGQPAQQPYEAQTNDQGRATGTHT
jgi:hypothetical protein